MTIKSYTRLIYLTGVANVIMAGNPLSAAEVAQGINGPRIAGSEAITSEAVIEEITVTAQRRSESLNRVPMTISAFSGDTLASVGAVNPESLSKLVPSLVYTKSAYGAPVLTLRGVGYYDYSISAVPAVTVYVDEVPLPYSRMAQFAGNDVQRVEVLKGPQGTLYGQNSTGGAINYLANRSTDVFQAGLSVSYARFNDTLIDGYVSGPLTDTVRARLAFNVERADGWQYSVTRPADRNGRKNLSSGRLLLDWEPSDDWSIGLNINGGLDRSDTQAAQFRGPTISEPGFSLLRNNQPQVFNFPVAPNKARAADFDPTLDLSQRNSLWQAALTVQHQLTGDIALKSITSFVQYKQFQPLDIDGTPYDAFGGPVSGNLKSLYQELRVQREGEGLNWIVGANYIRDKIVERQHTTSTQSGFSIVGVSAFDNSNRQKADAKSIYGNITYPFADRLKLEAGLRYTKQKRNFTACSRADDIATATIFSSRLRLPIAVGDCLTLGATGVPGIQRDELTEDSLSWRATLNWQASSDFLAYATVSRGYKGGSFPISGATSYLQYRPVKQESLLDLEAGLKASLFDRRAQLNLAGFYYDYRNKQVRGKFIDAATQLAFSGLVNVPKARLYGAEAQLSLRLSRALTIGANATYVNSKISAPFANVDFYGFARDFEGEPLPFAPKWSMVGRADFDQPVTEQLAFFAGTNVNYQSSTNAALGQQPAADIRSFYTLDVRAGIKTLDDKVSLSVWGRNITNQYYWTGVNLVLDVVTRYAAQPATYGVTLAYKM